MKSQYLTIKTVALNNHCPECYSREGLRLTFKQKFNETFFYKSLTSEIKTSLQCSVCETNIFPVRWTNEIERVVAYQSKAIKPKSSSLKLKRNAWILMITIDVIIILALLIAFDVIKI